MNLKFLSFKQVEQFWKDGYIHLRNCFDIKVAEKLVGRAYDRLGVNPEEPHTWLSPLIHMNGESQFDLKTFSPKVWAAISDLLGGEDNVKAPVILEDNFILNLSLGSKSPWKSPSSKTKGWHKDGDFFWHFLDSPEQALMALIVWKDIEEKGGGTFLALDSIKPVAEHLLAHPEGLHPFEGGFDQLIHKCARFKEITGKVGDVILIHPFMLHASSQNHLGTPRFITNPVISALDPFVFKREHMGSYSILELSVLYALGVKELDFSIEGERKPFDHSGYKYMEVYWSEELATSC
ncbi:MAG: phytanoyl-CoA dioxygenase family protein [Bacteroidota bacterium]